MRYKCRVGDLSPGQRFQLRDVDGGVVYEAHSQVMQEGVLQLLYYNTHPSDDRAYYTQLGRPAFAFPTVDVDTVSRELLSVCVHSTNEFRAGVYWAVTVMLQKYRLAPVDK